MGLMRICVVYYHSLRALHDLEPPRVSAAEAAPALVCSLTEAAARDSPRAATPLRRLPARADSARAHPQPSRGTPASLGFLTQARQSCGRRRRRKKSHSCSRSPRRLAIRRRESRAVLSSPPAMSQPPPLSPSVSSRSASPYLGSMICSTHPGHVMSRQSGWSCPDACFKWPYRMTPIIATDTPMMLL